MFGGCKNIININFKYFKTKNIINMKYMFTGCINIINLDLSSFNTEKVIEMQICLENILMKMTKTM